MTVYLKFLNKEIELAFKQWAIKYFDGKKKFESNGFTIMVKFFLSKEGQDSFNRWKINESQKDPIQ